MNKLNKQHLRGKGIIAISGFARSGKDTLCEKLIQRTMDPTINGCPVAVRIGFGDNLKNEMAQTVKDVFKMDVWTEDPEEKAMLRPLMVSWAHVRRTKSRGTHWWQSVSNQVMEESQNRWVIIPDLRFSEYENDELFWLKRIGAKIIHLRKYELKSFDGASENKSMRLKRVFNKPPNDTEKKNDPLIRKSASYKIEWPEVEGGLHQLEGFVDDLVDYLNANGTT